MSALDQLRPFISLCQASGMIPYTIEDNLATKKFAKFTFSFKNFTTWWFLLLILSQIWVPFTMGSFLRDVSSELATDSSIPYIIIILAVVFTVSNLIQFSVSRWIVLLRYRQFHELVMAMQKIESFFVGTPIRLESSIIKRLVVGFVIAISVVSKSLIVAEMTVTLTFYYLIRQLAL